jgi:putative membrane protein
MRFAAIGLAGVFSVACMTAARAEDTASQDKKFVMDSGEGSLAEIQMAKLALKNSQNSDVRKFAEKMIHDHTMLIAEMKPFAQQMGVPPPTVSHLERAEKDEYERLEKKHGEEFDKDYIPTMVDDHHKDLADFQKEYDTTSNQKLKETVGKGEQVIKQHAEIIDGIAHKYNMPAPNTPSGL